MDHVGYERPPGRANTDIDDSADASLRYDAEANLTPNSDEPYDGGDASAHQPPASSSPPPPKPLFLVSLTWYRLLCFALIAGLGIPKAVLSAREFTTGSSTLDYIIDVIVAPGTFWGGYFENAAERSGSAWLEAIFCRDRATLMILVIARTLFSALLPQFILMLSSSLLSSYLGKLNGGLALELLVFPVMIAFMGPLLLIAFDLLTGLLLKYVHNFLRWQPTRGTSRILQYLFRHSRTWGFLGPPGSAWWTSIMLIPPSAHLFKSLSQPRDRTHKVLEKTLDAASMCLWIGEAFCVAYFVFKFMPT